MTPDEQRIRAWLTSLADVTAAGTEAVTAERIATTAALLTKDAFPPAAYTSDSLHHVAGLGKFFPAYADVRDGVRGYWEARRPVNSPALQDGNHVNLDPIDRSWVDFWHKRRADLFAQSTDFRWGTRDADLANLASVLQMHSPKAWAVVSGRDASYSEPTDAEREAVRVTAAAYYAEVKARHLGDKPALQTKPRDVALSGETLRRSRESRGVKVVA